MIKESGKMTFTINPQVYGQLLAEFQPQVITTEIENKRAIALAEKLSNQQILSPEEEKLLDLLITLIEKFESENYCLGKLSNSLSRLRFLIEENHLSSEELIEIFGSQEILSNVLNNQLKISQELAKKIGQRFKVDPTIFTSY
jgi:HTH-type transcriptional regulator/antitoxin HigA